MTHLSNTDRTSTVHLLQSGVDFANIETLVDVGGGMGHTAAKIAEHHPQMEIIVQDRPDVIARATRATCSIVPRHLRDRVKFMKYDFFEPQKIKAQRILLRCNLHNYSDETAVQILRNQSIAMTVETRIWIMDQAVSDGIPFQNFGLRTHDDVKRWRTER